MYHLLKLVTRLFAALPLSAARRVGRCCGLLAYYLHRSHRSENLADMAACFPGDPLPVLRGRLKAVYRHMGMNYAEFLQWIGGAREPIERQIHVEGMERFRSAIAQGRGALILTAHLGNWDLLAAWAATQVPISIIAKELKETGANRFIREARESTGLKVLPPRHAFRACLAALKKGEVIGFILDQNMTRDEGIFVKFFGRPACTSPGLAYLAAQSGAPVIPIFMTREPEETLCVRIHAPLAPPPDRRPASIQEATQRYTRVIEDAIRARPDQWIWMHRRWRTKPLEGEWPAAEGAMAVEEDRNDVDEKK